MARPYTHTPHTTHTHTTHTHTHTHTHRQDVSPTPYSKQFNHMIESTVINYLTVNESPDFFQLFDHAHSLHKSDIDEVNIDFVVIFRALSSISKTATDAVVQARALAVLRRWCSSWSSSPDQPAPSSDQPAHSSSVADSMASSSSGPSSGIVPISDNELDQLISILAIRDVEDGQQYGVQFLFSQLSLNCPNSNIDPGRVVQSLQRLWIASVDRPEQEETLRCHLVADGDRHLHFDCYNVGSGSACSRCSVKFASAAEERAHTSKLDWEKCQDCSQWFYNSTCLALHSCSHREMEEKAAAAAVQNLGDLCGDSGRQPAFLPSAESRFCLDHSDVRSELSWVDRSRLIFTLLGPLQGNVHLAAQLSGRDPKTIMDWVCVHDKNAYVKCWYETVKGM